MNIRGLNPSIAFTKTIQLSLVSVLALATLCQSVPADPILKNGWPQSVAGFVRSSPVHFPSGNKGQLGLIIGSHKDSSGKGNLYIFSASGEALIGDSTVAYQANDNIISSPAVADLNFDNRLEVLFGSDDSQIQLLTLPENPLKSRQIEHQWTKSLKMKTRSTISADSFDDRDIFKTLQSKLPIPLIGDIYSTPAVGQLDDDPELEIVVSTEGFFIYAFNPDGTIVTGSRMAYNNRRHHHIFTHTG